MDSPNNAVTSDVKLGFRYRSVSFLRDAHQALESKKNLGGGRLVYPKQGFFFMGKKKHVQFVSCDFNNILFLECQSLWVGCYTIVLHLYHVVAIYFEITINFIYVINSLVI